MSTQFPTGSNKTPPLEPLSSGSDGSPTSLSLPTLALEASPPTASSVDTAMPHEHGGIEGTRRRIPLVQERDEFVHPPENFAMMHKGAQGALLLDGLLSWTLVASPVAAPAAIFGDAAWLVCRGLPWIFPIQAFSALPGGPAPKLDPLPLSGGATGVLHLVYAQE